MTAPQPHYAPQPPVPPQYAPHPAHFPPGWPVLRRKPQVMVVPVVVIVVGALIGLGFTLLIGAGTAVQGHGTAYLVGLAFSTVVAVLGITYLTWLDRWEPEPAHLLWAAFLWGGGVALALALLFGSPFSGLPDGLQGALVAPVTEETAKGLFLVLVLLTSRRGRGELNSLTDALVYAGFLGIGFSFVEDIGYIASNDTTGDAATTAIRRGLGAFSHSVYTGMTAIGVWKAMESRGAMRVVWPFLGWCAAVALHGIHNGSTLFGAAAVIGAILVFDLGGFIVYLVLGIVSRRREGRVVAAQLHPMVANGWVTPAEATWLSSLRGRRAVLGAQLPPDERRRLRGFRDDATELAYVRDRLDRQVARRQQPSPELLAQHDELVGLLRGSRDWVTARLDSLA